MPDLAAPRNPAAMTQHHRRQEIAAILARGVLRLRQTGSILSADLASTSEKSLESTPSRLDVSAETNPHALARTRCARRERSHQAMT
jgi:hypothetical protein